MPPDGIRTHDRSRQAGVDRAATEIGSNKLYEYNNEIRNYIKLRRKFNSNGVWNKS
jgi:hypothetical protein